METTEDLLLKYRQVLRNALANAGVPSNPAVDDDWILEEINKKVTGKSIVWARCKDCGMNFPDITSCAMHVITTHRRGELQGKQKP
ncbi:MAG: hypothetical protein ABL917_00570 [Parcubacteria group bacterium]